MFQATWRRVETNSKHRTDFHISVSYNDSIYIHGGGGESNSVHNSTFQFSKRRWKELSKGPFRKCHSGIIFNDSIYIFGGIDEKGETVSSLDCYHIPSNSWSMIVPATEVCPSPRSHHTAVVSSNFMYVFSGRPKSNEKGDSDIYVLELYTHTWTRKKCNGSIKPKPRFGHAACIYDDKMFIYGGELVDPKDDQDAILWQYNINDNLWSPIELKENLPKRLFVSNCLLDEIWYFFGGKENNSVCNFLFQLDLNTFEWKKINIENEYVPRERKGASLLWKDDHFLLFGGSDDFRSLYDVFELRIPKFEIKGLLQVLQAEIDYNIIFDINGTEFRAHKCIVSMSETIDDLIREQSSNQSSDEILKITINEVTSSAFKRVIHFMYSGTVDFSTLKDGSEYGSLVFAASYFKLRDLEILLLKKFNNFIRDERFTAIYQSGYKHPVLQALCFNYYLDNQKALQPYIEKLDNFHKNTIINIKGISQTPTFGAVSGVSMLKRHCKELYRTKKYSDVTLVSVNGKRFKCHKPILIAFSEFFQLMFQGSFQESTQQEVILDIVEGKYLNIILEFVYTGVIDLSNDYNDLINIFEFADMLIMKDFCSVLERKLMSVLCKDNVLQIYHLCKDKKMEGELSAKCERILSIMSQDDLVASILKIQEHYQNIIHEKNLQLAQQQQYIQQLEK